jgi:hypothetical protein
MALLRVHHEGRLKATVRTRPVIHFLRDLGWIAQTTRRDEFEKTPAAASKVQDLLDTAWPEWQAVLSQLLDEELPLDADVLTKLQRRLAVQATSRLPPFLHRKTLASALGLHSKATLPSDEELARTGTTPTSDNVLRLRASRGLKVQTEAGELDCDSVMNVAGEVILPERAFSRPLSFAGVPPSAVMTVENLGAFIDLPAPPTLLLVHTPGWETTLARHFLEAVPPGIALHHFGDLDPKGIEIFLHLARVSGRPYRWFVPSFWKEYLEFHGLKKDASASWPATHPEECVEAIRELSRREMWLEQETLIVDSRIHAELIRLCRP